MSAATKQTRSLSRKLFRLSFSNGALSADRVAGVLAWVQKHAPSQSLALLKDYRTLVSAEIARSQALVGHAGPLSDATVAAIVSRFSRTYGRPIAALPHPEPSLIAGLRIRIGDDVYESSIAGQLSALAAAT